jgi:hypothetical protein
MLPKELPQPVKEKLGNRFIYTAKKIDDDTYIVETEMPEISINFKRIRIFNKDGMENIIGRDTKMEVTIDGEEYTMVDINPKLLLRRLVKVLEG